MVGDADRASQGGKAPLTPKRRQRQPQVVVNVLECLAAKNTWVKSCELLLSSFPVRSSHPDRFTGPSDSGLHAAQTPLNPMAWKVHPWLTG